MNRTIEIRQSFERHAVHYEQNARIQHEIGLRLFERLNYLKIVPRRILDLGCGTGMFTRLLHKKYPKAQVIGCDLALGMLQQAKHKQHWWSSWPLINADMMNLPLIDGSIDLVFANQTIHWGEPISRVFREINRVMSTEACLMFTTLGPDTFKELKIAWSHVDAHQHVNEWMDLHDVGDCLMKEYFLDPVMDQELLTAHYSSISQLCLSLKKQGVRNINRARNPGLTSKAAQLAFYEAYDRLKTTSGQYPLTYEVVYGHAWKGTQRRLEQGAETFISIDKIKPAS